jgi:hypothetical protein
MTQTQLKITLPAEIRAELDLVSARSGLSLAEEIRRRLERTFAEDVGYVPTRSLAWAVTWLCNEINRHTPWDKSPTAHEALAVAIGVIMGVSRPKETVENDAYAEDDAQTLGRSLARSFFKHSGGEMVGGKS